MRYGLPYKGSKNEIAEWVVAQMPSRTNFYDLFCGGCAITHRALLTNKFKNFIINDLDNSIIELFINATQGKYKEEHKRWISRENFFAWKDTDPVVKHCWSFGNNGIEYLYGKDKEEQKYLCHLAVVESDYTPLKEKYNIDLQEIDAIKDVHKRRKEIKKIIRNRKISDLERLQHLERLEHLEHLEHLERLERLEHYNTDYSHIPIKNNSLIYCDIPYKGTDTYNRIKFDYDRFYDWCEQQQELVIISEYNMPEDRFYCFASIQKLVKLNNKSNSLKKIEKLYVPMHQKGLINQQTKLF